MAIKVSNSTIIDNSRNVIEANSVAIGTNTTDAKLEVDVGAGVTALDVQGSEGQLFSVTNNLTSGSIFSVNDVSGIPSIDVDADGTIQLAPYGGGEYVGVGTVSPTEKLDVRGKIRIEDDTPSPGLLIRDSDADGDIAIYQYNSGDLQILNNATSRNIIFQTHDGTSVGERLRINSGGSVGIGTNNPAMRLDVRSTANQAAQFWSVPSASPANLDASQLFAFNRTGAVNGLTFSSSDVRLLTATVTPDNEVAWRADKLSLVSTDYISLKPGGGVERLRITSGGDVGIGVTNPTAKLDVNGDINYNNNAIIASNGGSSNIDHLWHNDDNSASYGQGGTWHFVSDSTYKATGNSAIRAGAFANMNDTGTASQKLQITGGAYISGDVGIGSAAPTAKLDVDGTLKVSGISTFSTQVWNGDITWNTGKNIYISGESSFDVQSGGSLSVWDGSTSSNWIQASYGQPLLLNNNALNTIVNTTGSSDYFRVRHRTDTDIYMDFYCEENTAQIADTFGGNTDKKYIYFSNPNSSNDPGYIMHETRGAENNEGVLHLAPSDDNAEGDYVSIHGTNDADVLKLHTSGLIETATGFTLNLKSAGGDGVQINGNRVFHDGYHPDADKVKIVDSSSAVEKKIVFVDDQAAENNYESIEIDSSNGITFNPFTDSLTLAGDLFFTGFNIKTGVTTTTGAGINTNYYNEDITGSGSSVTLIEESADGGMVFKSNGGRGAGALQFYDADWRPKLKVRSGNNNGVELFHGESGMVMKTINSPGVGVTVFGDLYVGTGNSSLTPPENGTGGDLYVAGTINGTLTKQDVRNAMAQANAGNIGSYALLRNQSTGNATSDTTVAGSNLRFASAGGNTTGTPIGNWRLMGRTVDGTNEEKTSVWLRYE